MCDKAVRECSLTATPKAAVGLKQPDLEWLQRPESPSHGAENGTATTVDKYLTTLDSNMLK